MLLPSHFQFSWKMSGWNFLRVGIVSYNSWATSKEAQFGQLIKVDVSDLLIFHLAMIQEVQLLLPAKMGIKARTSIRSFQQQIDNKVVSSMTYHQGVELSFFINGTHDSRVLQEILLVHTHNLKERIYNTIFHFVIIYRNRECSKRKNLDIFKMKMLLTSSAICSIPFWSCRKWNPALWASYFTVIFIIFPSLFYSPLSSSQAISL